MSEFILSVGIDLGTSTTQLVFSRLEVENTASASSIPRIQIVNKEIIYRSKIHFTPLISRTQIDADKVKKIVEQEYQTAGITPQQLSAGAVIITGETARKENSEAVLSALSGFAGEFVVATAGSDLESIIAGRGSGTALFSKERGPKTLVNLDVGGGTTNLAVFKNGEPVDTSCLDIGGRLIILNPSTMQVQYISPKLRQLADKMGVKISESEKTNKADLKKLTDRMANIIAQSLSLVPATDELDLFYTAHPLKSKWDYQGITFSGGVADFVYREEEITDYFAYGDLGPLLGESIRNEPAFQNNLLIKPLETIRATVIGAGANTVDISGSTIGISDQSILPIKNIPILKLTEDDEANDFKDFSARLAEKITWYKEDDGAYQRLAISFKGIHNPSFEQVKDLTVRIIDGLKNYLQEQNIIILVIDHDMAKSLAYSIMNALPGKQVIAIDSVKVQNGDYIDIGAPLAKGRVVPVVIKTLVFGK